MDSIVNDPTRPPFPLSKNHHSNVYTTTLVKRKTTLMVLSHAHSLYVTRYL